VNQHMSHGGPHALAIQLLDAVEKHYDGLLV
jgi:hypothetical protein